MTSSPLAGIRRRLSASTPVLAMAVLSLSGCLPGGSSETATPGESGNPSPSVSLSTSPTATPSASPSPTLIETPGPTVVAPSGLVTPEVWLATIDEGAGELRVVAIVPDIYEDGGLCSVKVTGSTSTVLKEETGAADASYTACGEFTFSLLQLGPGTASIVVNYQSEKYSGQSEAMEVEIP